VSYLTFTNKLYQLWSYWTELHEIFTRYRGVIYAVQLKFHGTDTDTDSDTDFLADIRARILARMSACRARRGRPTARSVQ